MQNFIVFLTFWAALSSCSLPGVRNLNQDSLNTLKCERIDFSDVFADPSKYENKKLCGYVYVYHGNSRIRFYPTVIENWDEPNKKVILLQKEDSGIYEKLYDVSEGTKVFLSGKITYHKGCWQQDMEAEKAGLIWECAPYGLSLDFYNAVVYLF